MSFFQENKISLAIVLAGFLIGLGLYLGLRQNNLKTQTSLKEDNEKMITISSPPTPTSIPTLTKTLSPTSFPTVGIPQVNEEQIKKGLLAKTNISEDKLIFSIGERFARENKIFIRGTVRNKDEEHGAGFFAYCDLEKCEVTFVGQEVPKCSEVNPYSYPREWADYCIDEKGEIVKR
jgi:hypothetical protein